MKKQLPLRVVGSRENNLKEVTLEIPHDQLTVVTGLSGSGKSSLAFGTVYAEGQRRYIETFSPYTRQFLDKIKKPNVLAIEHVRPAIAIQQKTRIVTSRSTVGSITGINDFLKILWANLAEPYSPNTNQKLVRFTPGDVTQLLIDWDEGVSSDIPFLVVAPVELPPTKKKREQELDRLSVLGFSRFLNGEDLDRLENIKAPQELPEILEVVITRFKSGQLKRAELLEAIHAAYDLSRGKVRLQFPNLEDESTLEFFPRQKGNRIYLSDVYQLPDYNSEALDIDVPKKRPAMFDPNSALGACETCTGFGYVLEFDPQKIVPDTSLSIRDGAIHPWAKSSNTSLMSRVIRYAKAYDIDVNIPWHKLPEDQKEQIFTTNEKGYVGVIPWFKKLESKRHKMHVRVLLSRYRTQQLCPACHGARLRPESLLFKVADWNFADVSQNTIRNVLDWAKELPKQIPHNKSSSHDLQEVLDRLIGRLGSLVDLGLPYITLGRPSRTLSGGETQRVNLTTALGSELVSTHFVLDEPSVGLHPRDTDLLLKSIRNLQQKGNSVLMVEHDLDCISEGDHIIELGPLAGSNGGEVTYNGPYQQWNNIQNRDALPEPRKTPKKFSKTLSLSKLQERNLKNIKVDIPVGFFTTITGVSGSGKSTLVTEEIIPRWLQHSQTGKSPHSKGFQHFSQVLLVDQSGLTKSPRANIATYTGVWDTFRTLLSTTQEAEQRSLTKSSFSFNVEGGRCPVCKGAGYLREDMQFLSDVYVLCEECLGKRFQTKVLEVGYEGRNVAEWLNTTIEDIPKLLPTQKKTITVAENLIELGLGHLQLGHPLSELSGGEAQRLKLIPFLTKAESAPSLLIFDEPTTGLHLYDVRRLIALLRKLTLQGHTVLCIEHNQELILGSDWLIDLGPEGGEGGGEILLSGTPEDFLLPKQRDSSLTAKYLHDYVDAASHKNNVNGKNGDTHKIAKAAPLSITGAREHNLKDLSLEIPHNQVIAVTGVSGSGKSTLAKDIIYAEGQRRYLDCLSPYARQFINELSKPDVDEVKNIRPTVCVHQHTFKPGKRSTLGTMSEVYNYMRLLFSKAGTQYCPYHPTKKVEALSSEVIAHLISEKKEKKVKILAPIIKGRKGNHKQVFARALKSEIHEVRVDGVYHETGSLLDGVERNKQHDIDYVWATVVPGRVPERLIVDAVEEVFAMSGGTVILVSDNKEDILSRERACPECRRGFFRPDPEDLSFHSRRGRCEKCDGIGLWRNKICPSCNGSRLKEAAQHVRIGDKNISDTMKESAPSLLDFLTNLDWDARLQEVVKPIYQELESRLSVLNRVGLEYLPLERSCETLSSGELQRLRLAAALGTPLNGTMYIFDEPSAGLHPDDNDKILGEFHELKKRNNSVMLIEHDEHTILSADHVLEVGPGGGSKGGEVTYNGPINEYPGISIGEYENQNNFSDSEKVLSKEAGSLDIQVSEKHNVSNIHVTLPLHRLVTIAGVSGAGKSTLINEALLPLLMDACELGKTNQKDQVTSLTLSEEIDRVLVVDQSPIGRNSRSTPASYLKVWDEIRKLFATTIEARTRGWTASFFSYNSGDGRCKACKGLGRTQLEMSFLSEAYVTCEHCRGTRFSNEALTVRYQGATIADVLRMTFREAKELFSNHHKIHRLLHTATELGLGYLTLGQSSTTLSGGECQRIKLVTELARKPKGHTVYVLDEPTIGLHRKDVHRLLQVLHSIVALGNSVIIIEHDADVLRSSHHIVEMGPGPGERGGKIIFEGGFNELSIAETPWGRRLQSSDGPSLRSSA